MFKKIIHKLRILCKGTHFVTLKTRSSRTQRSTDTPNGGITFVFVKTISLIEPTTTKQSNLLNSETKYPWNNKIVAFYSVVLILSDKKNYSQFWTKLPTWKPKLYIFNIISIEKSTMKNIFVISATKIKIENQQNFSFIIKLRIKLI